MLLDGVVVVVELDAGLELVAGLEVGLVVGLELGVALRGREEGGLVRMDGWGGFGEVHTGRRPRSLPVERWQWRVVMGGCLVRWRKWRRRWC